MAKFNSLKATLAAAVAVVALSGAEANATATFQLDYSGSATQVTGHGITQISTTDSVTVDAMINASVETLADFEVIYGTDQSIADYYSAVLGAGYSIYSINSVANGSIREFSVTRNGNTTGGDPIAITNVETFAADNANNNVLGIDDLVFVRNSDGAASIDGNGLGFVTALGTGIAITNNDPNAPWSSSDFIEWSVTPLSSNGSQSQIPVSNFSLTVVPEPTTIALLSVVLLGLGLANKSRNRQSV